MVKKVLLTIGGIAFMVTMLLALFQTSAAQTDRDQDRCTQYLTAAIADMNEHERAFLVSGGEKWDGRAIKQILNYLECRERIR